MKLSLAFAALLALVEADSRHLRMKGNKKDKEEVEEVKMGSGVCQNFVPNPLRGVDQVRR